jgi:hypothetical protein
MKQRTRSIFLTSLGSILVSVMLAQAQQPAADSKGKTPDKPDAPPLLPSLSGAPKTDLSGAAPEGFVTRQEYDALLKRLADLEARFGSTEGKTTSREKEVDESLDELEAKNQELQKQVNVAKPGTSDFLVTGYGFSGFEDRPGSSARFDAGFSPIFLWRLDDRLFFESELEIGLNAAATDVNLEYADMAWIMNDYMTFKAGKFLTPFGIFSDRLHAAWINKLPDAPLPFGHDGIVPESQVGVQVSGGFPIGSTKFNYAVYAVNGPRLNLDAGEPADIGLLRFDNFTETNSRAYGGRIGFLPLPPLELGYSFQSISGPVNATLNGVDASFMREIDWLRGALDLRTEWIWSDAGTVRTVSDDGEPLSFSNKRSGGYAQLAYRPTKAKSDRLKNFELVGRHDWLDQPGGGKLPGNGSRSTVGLNYWLSPSSVLKAAYEIGNGGPDSNRGNSLLIMAAIGF